MACFSYSILWKQHQIIYTFWTLGLRFLRGLYSFYDYKKLHYSLEFDNCVRHNFHLKIKPSKILKKNSAENLRKSYGSVKVEVKVWNLIRTKRNEWKRFIETHNNYTCNLIIEIGFGWYVATHLSRFLCVIIFWRRTNQYAFFYCVWKWKQTEAKEEGKRKENCAIKREHVWWKLYNFCRFHGHFAYLGRRSIKFDIFLC